MKGEDRIRKAHRIAKAYEDAGFLFHNNERLMQMAAWAGITTQEAQRFCRMVEYVFAAPEPMPMALNGDDDNAPWVMPCDVEQLNKDRDQFNNLSMDKENKE
jgi:hypothetical protein